MLVLGGPALGRLVMTEVDLARKNRDFVSAVTYELRTSIAAIRMSGELLEAG